METFEPQLAGQHGDIAVAIAHPDRYAVEEKLDGIRALITIYGDDVTAVSRYGKPRSLGLLVAPFRRLAKAVPMLQAGTVLDGELVAADWGQTMHLLGRAGQREGGLRFVAFDIPVLAGRDMRGETWSTRRAALEALAPVIEAPIEISALLTPSAELAPSIWARGGEGLIIKDRNAKYLPGDRNAWTKVKNTETTEAVIMGFEPGTLHGKVILGQYADGELQRVAACKRQRANDGALGQVVEFSFIGRMPGTGAYRHPQWVRVVDKPATACTVA